MNKVWEWRVEVMVMVKGRKVRPTGNLPKMTVPGLACCLDQTHFAGSPRTSFHSDKLVKLDLLIKLPAQRRV